MNTTVARHAPAPPGTRAAQAREPPPKTARSATMQAKATLTEMERTGRTSSRARQQRRLPARGGIAAVGVWRGGDGLRPGAKAGVVRVAREWRCAEGAPGFDSMWKDRVFYVVMADLQILPVGTGG